MRKALQYVGQILIFAVVLVFIGYFSNRPIHRQFPADKAQIKLAFAHGAARKIDCRKLTTKEIAKLPQNERRPNTCTRERVPILIQLSMDGKVIFRDILPPTGLYSDGPGRTYKKLIVPIGEHTITAQLRDSKRTEGFDYENTKTVKLKPHQNLAIDFKADNGGFQFQ